METPFSLAWQATCQAAAPMAALVAVQCRGVDLVPPVLMPEGEVPRGIPISGREKQEQEVMAALAERKRLRILH